MISPKVSTLLFALTGQYVEAQIVELTRELAEGRIHRDWWTDASLMDRLDPMPIDRHWNWNEMGIEYEGRPLPAVKVAIMTGDQGVQGAMMVSIEPVPSVLVPDKGALFVELLFTAPRNRPALRRDGKPYFVGVGSELLAWGASLSRTSGFEGRLLLDGSPDYLLWYEKRGLQKLDSNPIVFEGVGYTPMELSVDGAQRLLADWE